MTEATEGVAWVAILVWLGLAALLVLVLAWGRYQRTRAARKEARRLEWEVYRQAARVERERDAQRWQRGRP